MMRTGTPGIGSSSAILGAASFLFAFFLSMLLLPTFFRASNARIELSCSVVSPFLPSRFFSRSRRGFSSVNSFSPEITFSEFS